MRGVVNTIIITCIFMSFKFANLAGINLGVISSVLTAAVFFSAIIFYLAYGEKLGCSDWIGALCIVTGVCLIGLFKDDRDDLPDLVLESQSKNTWTAICLAGFAAFLIGISDGIISVFYEPTLAKMLATLFVVMILIIKPGGIFGEEQQ